jgi:hypothetical protein
MRASVPFGHRDISIAVDAVEFRYRVAGNELCNTRGSYFTQDKMIVRKVDCDRTEQSDVKDTGAP